MWTSATRMERTQALRNGLSRGRALEEGRVGRRKGIRCFLEGRKKKMNATRNDPVGKTRKKVVVGCKRMESNDARDQESWKESLRRIRPARSGLLLFLTLLYVALYIFESSHSPAPEWAIGLDRVLVLVFASDYALTLFLASKEWYVEAFSFEGVISLASFLPQLLEEMHLDFLPGELAGATRVLRVLRVLRLAVLLPYLQAAGIISKDAVQLRLASLVVTITGLLLTTASIVQVTEKVPWLDALYFVLTTITTVGYGDVTAHTLLGKLTVIGMLLAALLLVPLQTSQLVSLLVARRQKLGIVPKSKTVPALLLVMQLNDFGRFLDSFEEIFHETKDLPSNFRLICLCSKPEFEYRALQELNQNRLTFCEGSALSEEDLVRAGVENVQAVLLIVDRFPTKPEEEDRTMLLKLWSIKSKYQDIPIVVQVLDQTMQKRMQAFLGPRDQAISLRRAKNRLLSAGVHCPGVCTLISNLLTGVTGTTASKRIAATRDTLKEGKKPPRWIWEYIDGASQEVYTVPVPGECIGVDHCKLTTLVFSQSGAVLLGVAISEDGKPRRVVLNPGNYELRQDDLLLLLAKSSSHASQAVKKSLPYVTAVLKQEKNGLPTKTDELARPKLPMISAIRGSFDELFSLALMPGNGNEELKNLQTTPEEIEENLLLCGDLERIARFLQSYKEFWMSDQHQTNSTLRVRYIYPEQPEPLIYRELLKWGANWYKGSPTNKEDLINAGVLKGTRLVVLSYASQDSISPSSSDMTSVTDTDAIQIAYVMEELHRSYQNLGEPPYIVELDFTDSEKFLQPQVLPEQLNMPFDDACRSINWEALGEPSGTSGTGTNHGRLLQRLCNPFYAAGHIYVPAVLDRIAISSLTPGTPASVGIINGVFEELTKFNKIQLWDMPEELVGRTYGSLFLKLIPRGLVPLGLYRDRGRKGSQLHYVCTNPSPNTLLASNDKIYIVVQDRQPDADMTSAFSTDIPNENEAMI